MKSHITSVFAVLIITKFTGSARYNVKIDS